MSTGYIAMSLLLVIVNCNFHLVPRTNNNIIFLFIFIPPNCRHDLQLQLYFGKISFLPSAIWYHRSTLIHIMNQKIHIDCHTQEVQNFYFDTIAYISQQRIFIDALVAISKVTIHCSFLVFTRTNDKMSQLIFSPPNSSHAINFPLGRHSFLPSIISNKVKKYKRIMIHIKFRTSSLAPSSTPVTQQTSSLLWWLYPSYDQKAHLNAPMPTDYSLVFLFIFYTK